MVLGRPYLADGSRLMIYRAAAADYAPFEEFHYLPGHALSTRCYLAVHDGEEVAWCSTIYSVGNQMRRVHRFVVLPEAQGRGIGTVLINWVADREGPLSIRTRNHAFVAHLLTLPGWRPSKKRGPSTADERTGKGATLDAVSAIYATEPSRCETCGVTLRGRSHARFCSGACRQAAYRLRQTSPVISKSG